MAAKKQSNRRGTTKTTSGKKTSKKRVQNRSGYVRMVSGNRNLSYEGGCVL